MFAAVKPDKSPLGLFITMKDAQDAIAADEPDIIKQGQYQIHPIPEDPDEAQDLLGVLKLKIVETWKVEKFDGEYVGQEPVEIVELGQLPTAERI
jgi:hypothetical protein